MKIWAQVCCVLRTSNDVRLVHVTDNGYADSYDFDNTSPLLALIRMRHYTHTMNMWTVHVQCMIHIHNGTAVVALLHIGLMPECIVS